MGKKLTSYTAATAHASRRTFAHASRRAKLNFVKHTCRVPSDGWLAAVRFENYLKPYHGQSSMRKHKIGHVWPERFCCRYSKKRKIRFLSRFRMCFARVFHCNLWFCSIFVAPLTRLQHPTKESTSLSLSSNIFQTVQSKNSSKFEKISSHIVIWHYFSSKKMSQMIWNQTSRKANEEEKVVSKESMTIDSGCGRHTANEWPFRWWLWLLSFICRHCWDH